MVFFYDWRRDNIKHACELAVLVERIKEALGVEKVNLIAHSNGGLVARYYLRYGGKDVLKGRDCPLGGPEVNQPGAYSVHRLVTLGTPNGGSAKIVYYLANGADFAPWIRDLSKRVLFTMPGAYQLMPYGLNPDGSYAWLYEPDTWIRLVAGKEMAPKERGFLSAVLERAKAFREFLGPDAYGRSEEESVKRLLVIGDCFDTDDLSRQGDTLKYDTVPGDRTVTRRSAQQIAAPANLQVLYGCVEHGGLQRDPVLMNNVLKTMFEP